jgi:diguanylate cyclase (GGDEF)-like protein/PAS domain S-box-containing protein
MAGMFPLIAHLRTRAARCARWWRGRTPAVELAVRLLCVLPLFIGANWALLAMLHGRAIAEAATDNTKIVRVLASETRMSMRLVDLAMQDLGARWRDDPARFDGLVRARQALLAADLRFQVAIVSVHEQVLFGRDRTALAAVRDIGWLAHGDKARLIVGAPFRDPASGAPFLRFARLLGDGAGRPAGWIVLAVPSAHMSPGANGIDIGASGVYAIARADGALLARHPAPPRGIDSVRYRLDGVPPQPSAVLVESHVARTDGVERLYAWMRVADYPLVVAVGQAHAELLAAYYRQRHIVHAASAGMFLLLAAAWWFRLSALHQQRLAGEALSRSEMRLQFALEGAREVVWEWDLRSGEAFFSPGLSGVIGVPVQSLPANTGQWVGLMHPDDIDRVKAAVRAHVAGEAERYACEYRVRAADGAWRWISARGIAAAADARGRTTLMTGVLADVTEARNAQEAERSYRLRYDALTGLENRAALMEHGQQWLTGAAGNGNSATLLAIDLDRFSLLNEGLGHDTGNVVLQLVARRLQAVGGGTCLVARLDGNGFAMLALDAGDEYAIVRFVQQVRAEIARPLDLGGKAYFLTCSVGIASFPADSRDIAGLLDDACQAMRRAKDLGRDGAQFYRDAPNERTGDRLRIEAELRQALARGELYLHYQPQVDLATGRVTGAEALVRWHSAELGFVPPDRFIPIAEEAGLIREIGHWVLREACLAARRWHDAGHSHLRIGVNLSPHQFRDPHLVEQIAAVLHETGLPAGSLDLEITEGVVLDDVDTAVRTMWRMKLMGIALSLDDFGTGYSSLSYLRQLPIDKLKIDKSFIAHVTADARLAAITTSIIAMAQGLGLSVVAEGVESAEQLAFLRRHACDVMQGYHFSRPLAGDVFADLLAEGRGLPVPVAAAA